MKIGLGTVQFGLDYGISNATGKTPATEAAAIVQIAREAGVLTLDTAPAYGDSETVLGQAIGSDPGFRIVTKTLPVGERFSLEGLPYIEDAFLKSLRQLGRASVYGLLAHRVEDLLGPHGDALFGRMSEWKSRGLVTRIGASVYTADQVDALLDRYRFDLVQLPFNVLDQRMLARGTLKKLKAAGVEIHARSAFLQGLLLMEPDSLDPWFAALRPHLESYRGFLRGRHLTPLQAALGFAIGIPEIDAVICGVNTAGQLKEILDGARPLDAQAFAGFAIEDVRFVDPSNWKKT